MIIAIVIALGFAAFLLCMSWMYISDRLRYNLPPGPTPIPIFGTLRQVAKLTKGIKDQHKRMSKMSETYGKVFTLYAGQLRVVVLQDADLIQEAIVAGSSSFSGRPSTIFKDDRVGVTMAIGDKWRDRRRFVMRSLRDFGMGRANIVEKVHDEVGYLVQEVDKCVGKPFTPHHLLGNAVSNIICSIVFGKRFDYEDPFFKGLLEKTAILFTTPTNRDNIQAIFPFLRKFIKPAIRNCVDDMEIHIAKVLALAVEDRRSTFSAENIRDFADLYIDAEQKTDGTMSIREFSRIVLDLFLAGTETTATALNWTLVWLCKHPEIQKRCIEAVDSVMGAGDRLPNLEDRPQLAYIDAVMYEALRHPTVAPMSVAHATSEDGRVGGYDVPAGTIILPNIWQAHHDESYWKDPFSFNPDRWLDASGKLVSHGNHFVPFGSGPRVCLGESLARVEYFIFLVSLLQRFSFSFMPGEDVDIDAGASGITYIPPHYKLLASRRI